MARFRCCECKHEGVIRYRPGLRRCPRCRSGDLQVAISVSELPDDDPIVIAVWKQIKEPREEFA
jgi:hypothetical protein